MDDLTDDYGRRRLEIEEAIRCELFVEAAGPSLSPRSFFGKEARGAALRQAGPTFHIHHDHFPTDAKDEDWLVQVGQRGWIVLTKDHRIWLGLIYLPGQISGGKLEVVGLELAT